MNPKPLRHVDLYSDAGRLEALYRDVPDPVGVAIVCHPLPTHGGTMHNKVVFRAARGLEDAGFATLRFNFRGAGASQGRFDEGEGEQRDFEAALDWIRDKHPDKPVIAGGFSFGSWVSTRVACDSPHVDAVFLLGAPIDKYSLHYLRSCPKPKLVIQGDRDEFGNADRLAELSVQWPETETIIVEGADHFFKRQLEVVQESMKQWAIGVVESLPAP
ncbi:MAG: alpha/beta fold hydrolase [Thermoanaerobaculia bacterium]|nr:alpha/beta fold hydrolase [Thermoanaerobaculia bacterium]